MILKQFKTIGVFTLIVLFLLIGIGGIVHVTGSESGCPDWPKCFGHWIPPSCECELPDNYHTVFKESGYPPGVNYNPVKAWIHYLSGVLGAMALLLSGITVCYGFMSGRRTKAAFRGSAIGFLILLLAEGIEAGYRASDKLEIVFQTGYLLKTAAACFLIYSVAAATKANRTLAHAVTSGATRILWIALIAGSLQFCVSVVWEQAGGAGIHLLLAAPVIALNALVWFKFKTIREFRTACNGIAIGIFAETGTGIVLLFSRSTQWNQVLHLWLPAITTGGLVYILSYIYSKETASIADF